MAKLKAFYELEKLVVLSLQMQAFNNVHILSASNTVPATSNTSFAGNANNLSSIIAYPRVNSAGPPSVIGSEINTPLLSATRLQHSTTTAEAPSIGLAESTYCGGVADSRRNSISGMTNPDSVVSSTPFASNTYAQPVLHSLDGHSQAILTGTSSSAAAEAAIAMIPNTDEIAEELRRIFKSHSNYTRTLFRDLQFIASFVPSNILDLTDMGKAFWDVSLAALSLKEEYLDVVMSTASDIFKYCTEPNAFAPSTLMTPDNNNNIPGVDTKYKQFISQFGIKDCVMLWTIAAKEGDTNGQRELAIMYISQQQVVPQKDLVLAPFARPSDVIPTNLLHDLKRSSSSGSTSSCGSSGSNNHGDVFDSNENYSAKRVDPLRMAVVKHWMTNAAVLGDSIANEYLSRHQQDSGYYSK